MSVVSGLEFAVCGFGFVVASMLVITVGCHGFVICLGDMFAVVFG